MEEIIRRVKIFEGFREKPYVCTAGKWTIGYGYNYQDRGFTTEVMTEILKSGFTEKLAEELMKEDVKHCVTTVEKVYPFYHGLSEPRQAVVVDMVYQMGLGGFQKFRKMISALVLGDYKQASAEMKDSRWFKQSGRRSAINVEQMLTGEWQEVK